MHKISAGLTFITICLFYSCEKEITYDLAIKNVQIFDSENKSVLKSKTILINADTIANIVDSDVKINTLKSIKGKNRLVTPGFIDTHIHLTDIYGDYENAPETLSIDSVKTYQTQFADTYLEYGTTTVVDMGQPEKWMDTTIGWQKNPMPNFPNLYITGGAMISDEERETYVSHTEVLDPEDAKLKVQTYSELGVEHLKLYWRLREPEMKAILAEATEKKMHIYGHIDQNAVSIQRAMELGVQNFEHFLSLPASVFNYDQNLGLLFEKYNLTRPETTDEFIVMLIFTFQYIKDNTELEKKLFELLDEMSKNKVTLSTTIHLLGSVTEKTYFFTSIAPITESTTLNLPNYNKEQKAQLSAAFETMMNYLKIAYEKDVIIRIGTDCRDGGKALLSELQLLFEAGLTMGEVLQIATYNGAQSMKLGDSGSISNGKKADLIIFEKNPFKNYKNILSDKIIIKDGIEFMNK